ncbi:MAG: peptidoglycan-associated lipoprotein Pal [Elusimicrobia bacterium]|nr:peptidoglycan-associated lipoprotein Pal [Elusimicrobiota bacterium]
MKKILLFTAFAFLLVTAACARRRDVNVGTPPPAPAWQAQEIVEVPTWTPPVVVEEPTIRNQVPERNVNLRMVHFAFDSSDLNAEAMGILRENAAWLQANRDARIVVEGHTDERGTIEYNLALGQRRANRVRDVYIQLGVAPGRIATISFGKEMPIDNRSNEAGWARNRRAETLVMQYR